MVNSTVLLKEKSKLEKIQEYEKNKTKKKIEKNSRLDKANRRIFKQKGRIALLNTHFLLSLALLGIVNNQIINSPFLLNAAAIIHDADSSHPGDQKSESSSGLNVLEAQNLEIGLVERLKKVTEKKMKTREEFLESLPNVSVNPRNTAHFECELEAQIDISKLLWLKLNRSSFVDDKKGDDELLTTPISLNQKLITRDRRFRVTQASAGRFQLTLENVDPSDHLAYFVCQSAGNMGGSRSSGCGSCGLFGGGQLNVLAPPHIIEEETSTSIVLASEYEPLTLRCKVHGDPRSQLTWKRENMATLDGTEQRDKHDLMRKGQGKQQLSSDSSELLFVNFTRNQSGAYLCIASNGNQPGVSQRINVLAIKCRASHEPNARQEPCEDRSEVANLSTIQPTKSSPENQQPSIPPRKSWRSKLGSGDPSRAQIAQQGAPRTRVPDRRRLVNPIEQHSNGSLRHLGGANTWMTLVALVGLTTWLLLNPLRSFPSRFLLRLSH